MGEFSPIFALEYRKCEGLMRLEGERIYLREWSMDDASELFFYASNPKIGSMAGWPVHKSIQDSKRFIDMILSAWGFFAIVLKETKQIIGSINVLIGEVSNFQIEENHGELGFWLGEPHWRKGYMTEAIEIMLDYCFYDLGLTKVWCGCFEENIPSRKLQEQAGFEYAYTIDCAKTLFGDTRREIVNVMNKEGYEEMYE